MADKKIKILTISDHPFSPSGVGTQSKYVCVEMLKTGKYKFVSLGGAIKHQDPRPIQTEEWKEDWIIFPVEGYGNPEIIRSIIRTQKPDILWFMTDPRFYVWLWQMENEIRPLMPMVYYHVWDNYPYPKYNKPLYESNDCIVSISKLTSDIVKNVAPSVEEHYLPHAVPPDLFKRLPDEEVRRFRGANFPGSSDKMIFFWNNRNARRKQSGTVIWWFKSFLDKVGHDKAILLMHTDPKDENGQELNVIIKDLGLVDNKAVLISKEKLPPEHLNMIYNAVDCTINISDAEGFGLSTFESLCCGTPIIVNMTGGLQEQVTDGTDIFGVGIQPCSRAVIGSQGVPYIYEDRISEQDFVDALTKFYNTPREERKQMGLKGMEYIQKNYGFQNFVQQWDKILAGVYEKHGSWETRKNHKSYEMREI